MLITYGVNVFGKREVLGFSVSLSEAEVHWREFLESLVKRGLNENSFDAVIYNAGIAYLDLTLPLDGTDLLPKN